MPLSILIADMYPDEGEALREMFTQRGAEAEVVQDGDEALEKIMDGGVDALVTETVLKGRGGRELIDTLLLELPAFPIFVRTKHASVDEAFRLARFGVKGYSLKSEEPEPFVDRVLHIASGRGDPEEDAEGTEGSESGEEALPFSQYRSRNAEMAGVFEVAVQRVAKAPSTVLITGESGTGKELLARTIHHNSPRRDGPWIAVNASALPENLIESELFGHEKGAFTGATSQRKGRFEQADGGTFFLDEVGDLSQVVQTKLLRVLQERSFERVGGNREIKVDVRVIAATHRNLKKMIRSGEFREDLYYRLSVITLNLPPLRERPEDIPGLARFFVERFRKETGREPMVLTPRAIKAMKAYPWPGNVRELENVVERAVVMAAQNRIDLDDLPEEVQKSQSFEERTLNLRDAKAQFERDFVEQALRQNRGNVSATADMLGIARKNLQEKVKRYQIDVETMREQGEPSR